MDLRQVKDMMAAMRRNGARRLVYEKDGIRLELEMGGNESSKMRAEARGEQAPLPVDVSAHTPHKVQMPVHTEAAKPAKKEEEPANGKAGTFVKAPIVGTFYRSPAPGEGPFVKEGDQVTEETVVCIIEAMKVMNEVKAGVAGRVEEVLIEDGHPVEFGSQLYRIVES